jgi:hypothetical protein
MKVFQQSGAKAAEAINAALAGLGQKLICAGAGSGARCFDLALSSRSGT